MTKQLMPGMTVKHRKTGAIGRTVYSTFGLSVSGTNERGRWQTIGAPAHEVATFWEPVKAQEGGASYE